MDISKKTQIEGIRVGALLHQLDERINNLIIRIDRLDTKIAKIKPDVFNKDNKEDD